MNLNLELSGKERLNKIVEILAEGVLNLVRHEQRISAFLHQRMREWMSKVFTDSRNKKSFKSCSMTISYGEVTVKELRQKRVCPSAKSALLPKPLPASKDIYNA